MLRDVMDKWQQSSRCCPELCGPRCGLVILYSKNSGHGRNVLFERCAQHGGDGHEHLIKTFSSEPLTCKLIYGYSIKEDGKLSLNSGTFNGYAMPRGVQATIPQNLLEDP